PLLLPLPCGLPYALQRLLSTDRSPSPSLDITTTVSGLLCWRDFHPLEWQLASLHWSGRVRALPAFAAARAGARPDHTILMCPVKYTAHGFPSPRGHIVKFLH